MISAPVFFAEREWVDPPTDWAKTGIHQQGKTYDLQSGEGRRILEECLALTRHGAHYWNVEPAVEIVAEGSARYGWTMVSFFAEICTASTTAVT